MRVHTESGKSELIINLINEPGELDKVYNGSSFSFDRDGDELFYVSDVEGQPTQIAWYRPRTDEPRDRFPLIDETVRIGALAVSPDARTLALRVGSPGNLSTPALLDLTSRRLTPLVPDDGARESSGWRH